MPMLHAEFRTFTNDWGDSIKAELIELKDNDTIVRLKYENGRKVDAPISVFSQADKKFIRDWWKKEVAEKQVLSKQARVDFEVTIDTKTRNRGSNSYYSDRDDVTKSFYPEVLVENLDAQDFTGNEIRLVVFAQDIRYKDQIRVVSASNKTSDFKKQSDVLLEFEAFRLRHYEYDSHYSSYEYAYGYKYDGYALSVKNSKGEVVHEEATKPKYLNPKNLYKCKKDEMYDIEFKRKLASSTRSSSSYID